LERQLLSRTHKFAKSLTTPTVEDPLPLGAPPPPGRSRASNTRSGTARRSFTYTGTVAPQLNPRRAPHGNRQRFVRKDNARTHALEQGPYFFFKRFDHNRFSARVRS